MQDPSPALQILYVALMGASMMLTWQVSRLRRPAPRPTQLGRPGGRAR